MFSYIGRELLEYSSPALPKVQSSYVGQVRPLLALPRLLEAKTTSREEGLLLHALQSGSSEWIKRWKLRSSSLYLFIHYQM